MCSTVRCNFMRLPFGNSELDGAYAIEATCHAADKTECYSEIARVIKPGCCFVGYEWVITDKFDSTNAEHCQIKHSIEKGNGKPRHILLFSHSASAHARTRALQPCPTSKPLRKSNKPSSAPALTCSS